MMNRVLTQVLLCCLLFSGAAFADIYWVDSLGASYIKSPGGFDATMTITTPSNPTLSHSTGTWAGIFTIHQGPSASGPWSNFSTICIDPIGGWPGYPPPQILEYQRSDSAGYSVDAIYVTETGVADSNVLENAVERLWHGVGGITGLTDNIQRAAFQSLVWEIMLDYNQTGFGNLGAGKMVLTGFNGNEAAVYSQAQTWANNLVAGTGAFGTATPLRFWKDLSGIGGNFNYQDFIDTPEPGFYGALAVGMSALFLGLRRRRSA